MALGSLVSTKLQDLIWDGLTVKTVPLTTNPLIFRKGTLDPFLYGPSQGFLDEEKAAREEKGSSLLRHTLAPTFPATFFSVKGR